MKWNETLLYLLGVLKINTFLFYLTPTTPSASEAKSHRGGNAIQEPPMGCPRPPTAPAARQSARGTYYTKYICNSNPLSSHNDFLPSRKGASHHLAIRPNKTIRTTPTSCMIQRRQSNRGARGDWYDYIPFKASSNIKLYQNAVSVSHFWIHIRLQLT